MSLAAPEDDDHSIGLGSSGSFRRVPEEKRNEREEIKKMVEKESRSVRLWRLTVLGLVSPSDPLLFNTVPGNLSHSLLSFVANRYISGCVRFGLLFSQPGRHGRFRNVGKSWVRADSSRVNPGVRKCSSSNSSSPRLVISFGCLPWRFKTRPSLTCAASWKRPKVFLMF